MLFDQTERPPQDTDTGIPGKGFSPYRTRSTSFPDPWQFETETDPWWIRTLDYGSGTLLFPIYLFWMFEIQDPEKTYPGPGSKLKKSTESWISNTEKLRKRNEGEKIPGWPKTILRIRVRQLTNSDLSFWRKGKYVVRTYRFINYVRYRTCEPWPVEIVLSASFSNYFKWIPC